ncbi:right-handed parallel beta-helix repeat-containing protein [Pseudomonas guariconensis]|uniref:right-handed parallel beta-helix repeat-containing protein n=1 Tax=Pseudomonas TaxID=286 RepID=UPI0020982220|nr:MULTISPECIES: right-handed parallel beta-helix repeat-containing protein [Pseudomonas]MCO7638716.1 right-handed parallel beta-helix repeat-containing protein [Pseudomonas sp. S 311-6]MCO7514941.1 right-handed parallel beta-helix repeat-containing protein [Pseudomonas putida]MCO7564437.1 right-handed parallel beta-helix repeat-containing protein [Pseudomonas mosselii]MCO7595327.1 right-handed parallel beta-helix repeat-containing protein [Pseudomonas guariconensis]MCO7604168.1 right-handed p
MALLARFSLTCLAALLLAGTAQAGSQALPVNQTVDALTPEEHQRQVLTLRQQARQAVTFAQAERPRPAGRASVSLQPMFSSQAGSWPFEPFVNNGLFRAIAGYQAHHPQVVMLRGGSITLAQLNDALANPRILRRYKDGYLLSYPLLIGPDAGLVLEGTSLYLYSFSGTALINQGWLGLNQSSLESVAGDKPGNTDRAWRPFVVAWAGSHTQVIGSTLRRLGYNANLSRGLTTALSPQQPAGSRLATVLIRDSRFSELSTAVELQHSQATISTSQFEQSQQYAIDVRDSQLSLRGNQLRGIDNNSGVRLRGQTRALLEDNLILGAGKAAIEISEQQGAVLLASNRIGDSRGNGIQLRNLAPTSAAPLLIDDNLLASSQGTAVDASDVGALALVGNRIGNTPEYAVSLRNATPLPGPLLLSGNRLGQVGKAVVRVEGVREVALGGNSFDGKPLLQNLLIGDLLPLQARLLEATVRQGGTARVRWP